MKQHALHLAVALAAMLAMPGAAAAANAIVTAELRVRAGPSTEFPVVGTVPARAEVDVNGCVRGYSWCDISWRDERGWVSADYLQYYYQERYVPLIEYGPTIEVPIVVFSIDTYWGHYYRHRPWYHRRVHWRNFWRRHHRDHEQATKPAHRERASRNERRRQARAEHRQTRSEHKVQRHEHQRKARAARHERRHTRAAARIRHHRAVRAERHRHRINRSVLRSLRVNRHAGRALRGNHGFRAPSAAPHRSMSQGASHPSGGRQRGHR
jgi:uncharacterized protein YraI